MEKKIKVYYEEDSSLDILNDKKVGIIGYGIQGKAQALNLRDSGVNVRIGNQTDEYFEAAVTDGFIVKSPSETAKWANIIMFLIPDDAQKDVYNESIKAFLTTGKTILFAHGYSLYYDRLDIPKDVDILLLAPRMPGKYIRERYLNGWGAPVFINVVQDATGKGLNIVLALSHGIGATRIGAMDIDYKEETEIDLFIEQYLLPTITSSIHKAFDFLISKGFTPEAVISELYASGEIGELIRNAATSNIYQQFRDHASPTCQFGKMKNIDKYGKINPSDFMESVLTDIRTGKFDEELSEAAKENHAILKAYDKKVDNSVLVKTHQTYNNIHRLKKDDLT